MGIERVVWWWIVPWFVCLLFRFVFGYYCRQCCCAVRSICQKSKVTRLHRTKTDHIRLSNRINGRAYTSITTYHDEGPSHHSRKKLEMQSNINRVYTHAHTQTHIWTTGTKQELSHDELSVPDRMLTYPRWIYICANVSKCRPEGGGYTWANTRASPDQVQRKPNCFVDPVQTGIRMTMRIRN